MKLLNRAPFRRKVRVACWRVAVPLWRAWRSMRRGLASACEPLARLGWPDMQPGWTERRQLRYAMARLLARAMYRLRGE